MAWYLVKMDNFIFTFLLYYPAAGVKSEAVNIICILQLVCEFYDLPLHTFWFK